ncbi:D-alanyl-D-alanine carboxypeptidase family protein [Pseudoruegeria sp. SK021]|uniref:D-alanyl-D-alanine carboxypeptidase family protein n=1 Tax=Pseudoruegeria sp. SK021 TaxID=1933035 RepID=UPI000A31FE9E|nr:D-alanyl-D-alanine carboxypeptidase family protein [Pseudoruegeria sp. SK021]
MTLPSGPAQAAPYAAMVIDARTGEVLHSKNADTRLHPASLTKMMTLYVVFDAVQRGEISLDTKVTVSKKAASQPPSKLYLKSGQKIALRYLIRASAVKSANDAALTMAEAISGSEAAFTERMTQTAQALGMKNTNFKNPHGLTQTGHYSTARDMTTLGRALFYHYPEYYNLFSRRSTDAGGKTVYNTNRRLLDAYSGADGIKTGYTVAAGFNLVASAQRGNVRVIATMFGGSSSAARNARVAELLDVGFKKAPKRASVRAPGRPNLGPMLVASSKSSGSTAPATVKSSTLAVVVVSTRPVSRPSRSPAPSAPVIAGLQDSIEDSLQDLAVATAASTAAVPASVPAQTGTQLASLAAVVPVARPDVTSSPASTPDETPLTATEYAVATVTPPLPRPAIITFSSSDTMGSTSGGAAITEVAAAQPAATVVPRVSTSGDRHWGITVGNYNSRYEAERVLLQTALVEIGTLDKALRKVVQTKKGYSADFVGLDERSASLACQRLQARSQTCTTFGP